MSKPAILDVRRLPYWSKMHEEVNEIIDAGRNAPKGAAHDHAAIALAAIILQHLGKFAAIAETAKAGAQEVFDVLISDAHASKEDCASLADYPEDDDSKLDPVALDDPSAQWDNRKTVH